VVTPQAKIPARRPRGSHEWKMSIEYALGALVLVAGSVVQTTRRRRTWRLA
jgi:hypothetical protein